MVGDMQVSFNSDTRFVNGAASDLVAGAKVEAEGLIVNGILVAEKIAFKDNLRMRALVTSVDSDASTLTILGITVSVPGSVDIRENGNAVTLAALTGRFVDLRGRVGADGLNIIASRIDPRNNDPGEAMLRGPVSASSEADNTLVIAGILINTAGTEFKGSGESHSIIAATQFFASITPNVTVVKVLWKPFTSTTVPAKEVELES
jgi:hypothetical protein